MKLKNVAKAILTLVFFFAVSNTFAQLPGDPDDDVDGPGDALDPAPISDYLIPMFVLGVATAFILLKKKAPARI